MIPDNLQRKLVHNITADDYKTLTRHLCALIDMGAQTAEMRKRLHEHLGSQLVPLMTEPGYETLTPVSAMLVAPPDNSIEGQHELIEQLAACNSDIVYAWIKSVLPAQPLAQHLRQATFAYGEQGNKYLLRYYDPVITPILYGNAPDDWQQWLFGPVDSWWFALPDQNNERWHELRGYSNSTVSASPKLILTEALMQKLTDDPLPYRIMGILQAREPDYFKDTCRGVAMARVEEHLKQAREQGLKDTENQIDYVVIHLLYPVLTQRSNPQWQQAMKQALAGRGRLSQLV